MIYYAHAYRVEGTKHHQTASGDSVEQSMSKVETALSASLCPRPFSENGQMANLRKQLEHVGATRLRKPVCFSFSLEDDKGSNDIEYQAAMTIIAS